VSYCIFYQYSARGEVAKQLLVSDKTLSDMATAQLKYVEDYLCEHFSPTSFIIESQYYDREYVDDYSLLYGKSSFPTSPTCQRVHFFTNISKDDLEKIVRQMAGDSHAGSAIQSNVDAFSEKHYLGYSVIKPLRGSPLGRSVLRHLEPSKPGRRVVRAYPSCKTYKAHFLGLVFKVNGLVFQQQDGGTSACATTALWTSIQARANQHEIRSSSPAKLTKLATRAVFPGGNRSVPSSGLTIPQVCTAINDIGLVPDVHRVTTYDNAIRYIYSTQRSSLAPIFVLFRPGSKDSREPGHAVTCVGAKFMLRDQPFEENTCIPLAKCVRNVYLHDDRKGPYLRAQVLKRLGAKSTDRECYVRFKRKSHEGPIKIDHDYLDSNGRKARDRRSKFYETWDLHSIITPMTSMVHYSLSDLIKVEKYFYKIIRLVISKLKTPAVSGTMHPRNSIYSSGSFVLSASQFACHLLGLESVSVKYEDSLVNKIGISPWTGVVRICVRGIGMIEVYVDMMSTPKNPKFLGVVGAGVSDADFEQVFATFENVTKSPSFLMQINDVDEIKSSSYARL
jgi:hypothetical protein